MLMHTRAFGDYEGPEEVMLRTNNFTEINLIDNYGSTSKIDLRLSTRMVSLLTRKGRLQDL